jgi:thiol-disulfide isomerase/thioredoxin
LTTTHLTAAASAVALLGLLAVASVTAYSANAGDLTVAAAQTTAPEFTGISQWLNSQPLTLAQLKGKVVLVDFWTYGCYNCVNTLPYVIKLQQEYGSSGFTVIGVHTPEFPYETSTANVAAAIKQYGITYPVAQDNEFATWNAYGNHYWPAQYILDKSGHIVFMHAGEGAYGEIETTIAKLLQAQS